MERSLLHDLFAYKAWADRELVDCLASADRATTDGLPTAVLRTLDHINVVDDIFRAHLLGRRHGYTATTTLVTPSQQVLADRIQETDAWYRAVACRLPADALNETIDFTFTDRDRGSMTRLEMLMHVLTHGCYHRGGIGAQLRTLGVEPPRELYTRFLSLTRGLSSSQPSP